MTLDFELKNFNLPTHYFVRCTFWRILVIVIIK